MGDGTGTAEPPLQMVTRTLANTGLINVTGVVATNGMMVESTMGAYCILLYRIVLIVVSGTTVLVRLAFASHNFCLLCFASQFV